MGLPYGWCGCIIYTVIYTSSINNVLCNSTSLQPSPSSTMIGSSFTNNDSLPNSQFMTTSFDSATASQTGMQDASLTITLIQASDTQFISSSSLSMISSSINNDTDSSLISIEMTSSVDSSSQPEMSSASGIAQSMSITPSQTVIGMSSELINASNSTGPDLSTASFRSSSSATYSSSQTSMLVTSSSVSSINDTDSAVLSPTSVLSSPSSLTGSSNIDSSSMYNGTTDSSVFTDISSSTSSPGQSSNQTASMSSSQQSSPTDMFTSSMVDTVTETSIMPSTQSRDLAASSSTQSLSTLSVLKTSDTTSQTTSMSFTSSIAITIQPSSTVGAITSSSVSPTPATANPSTTNTNEIEVSVDPSNVYKVPTNLSLKNCSAFETNAMLKFYILNLGINGVSDVIVIENTCANQRRKRSTTEDGEAKVNITVHADKTSDFQRVVQDKLHEDIYLNITDLSDFHNRVKDVFENPCSTDICDKYVGYMCENVLNSNTTVKCVSRCKDVDCSQNGRCEVIIGQGSTFGTHCVCNSEEYYKYEGHNCQTRRMKWELAVAIAGGVAGGIIIILVFALIVCCCCKSKDEQYKHRRDSYEPMSELVGKPAYYRNEGPKNHQTGFSNFGYEDDYGGEQRTTNGTSWNPEESKDTYAKISEQLGKDNSFQIKRPQVAGTRPTTVNEDSTEGEDGVLTMSHRL